MSYRIVASDRFRAQLDAIERWIAEQRDPATAVAIGEEILERCARLAEFLNRGTPHHVGVTGPGQLLQTIAGDGA